MTTVINLTGVDRNYRDVAALSDVNLSVLSGEVLGLLGPNGAGKTTLIRLLQGVLIPSSGKVSIWGESPTSLSVRNRCGNTPQDDAIPEGLSVVETLRYVSRHYPTPRSVDDVIDQYKLGNIARTRMSRLSGGQRRRVSVALAFVGSPSLVLLDEPTAGLDVQARMDIIRTIRDEMASGVTAIITSHYLDDIEALADSIAVLQAGSLKTVGPMRDFIHASNNSRVSFNTNDPFPIKTMVVDAEDMNVDGNRVTIRTSNPDELVRHLYASGVSITDLSVTQRSLEDAFVGLIREGVEKS